MHWSKKWSVPQFLIKRALWEHISSREPLLMGNTLQCTKCILKTLLRCIHKQLCMSGMHAHCSQQRTTMPKVSHDCIETLKPREKLGVTRCGDFSVSDMESWTVTSCGCCYRDVSLWTTAWQKTSHNFPTTFESSSEIMRNISAF